VKRNVSLDGSGRDRSAVFQSIPPRVSPSAIRL
jgi:hypothetical protein